MSNISHQTLHMTLIVWNFSTKTYFSRLRLFCAVPQLHISNDNSAGCEGLGVVAKKKHGCTKSCCRFLTRWRSWCLVGSPTSSSSTSPTTSTSIPTTRTRPGRESRARWKKYLGTLCFSKPHTSDLKVFTYLQCPSMKLQEFSYYTFSNDVLQNYPFFAQSMNGAFHSNGGDADRALNHLDPGMLRWVFEKPLIFVTSITTHQQCWWIQILVIVGEN